MFNSLISIFIYYNIESISELLKDNIKYIIGFAVVVLLLFVAFLWARKRDDKVTYSFWM